MKLTVTYDIDKEFDNLQRGLKSVFNPDHQPKLVREMIAADVDLTDKFQVDEFITKKTEAEKIDIAQVIVEVQEKWDAVEQGVTGRLDRLFATTSPFDEVTVYLSLNGRCAYNFAERYFFVCITRTARIGTIIHELMHFYTHLLIQPHFRAHDAEAVFGEFKESLTVLLNTEFKDVIEEPDKGYEKHTESREWIKANWKEGMTVQELAQLYLSR